MNPSHLPRGSETRETIDSLRGYVYQIYQTAVAWTELDATEFLFGMVQQFSLKFRPLPLNGCKGI